MKTITPFKLRRCIDAIAASRLYYAPCRYTICKYTNLADVERRQLSREEWLPLARKLDWDYSYVREDEVFPELISGPWILYKEWKEWEESFKTSYREYVDNHYEKDMAVYAVRDAVGRLENMQKLTAPWMNSLKVHAAALPLAEFTGVIGSLRGARFGRDSAWRTMATFGALDEYRHTQFPCCSSTS